MVKSGYIHTVGLPGGAPIDPHATGPGGRTHRLGRMWRRGVEGRGVGDPSSEGRGGGCPGPPPLRHPSLNTIGGKFEGGGASPPTYPGVWRHLLMQTRTQPFGKAQRGLIVVGGAFRHHPEGIQPLTTKLKLAAA